MALVIPDAQAIPTYPAQAVKDPTDDQAQLLLGQGYGVVSGCACSQHSTGDSSIAVASGIILAGWLPVAVTGAQVTPANPGPFDRRDIVVASSLGVLSVVEGTPCTVLGWTTANGAAGILPPVKPAIPAGSVLLGEYYCAGSTGAKPTVDASNSTQSAGGTTSTVSVTTTVAGDMIVVTAVSWGGVTATSVTAAGLTFTKRYGATLSSSGSAFRFEEWWAPCPGTGAQAITVNWSGTTSEVLTFAVALKGVDPTNPFDTNVSLPGVAGSNGTSAPEVTGISTTAANSFVLSTIATVHTSIATAGVPSAIITLQTQNAAFGIAAALLGGGLTGNLTAAAVGSSTAVGQWQNVCDALIPAVTALIITNMLVDKTPIISIVPGLVTGQTTDSKIIIPGLSASPDRKPASPSAYSDEFDEDGSGVPTGWTGFNPTSIPTVDTNTALSHLHLLGVSSSVWWGGIYKAVPSIPFTVTAKLADMSFDTSTIGAGLFIGGGTPGVSANPMLVNYLYSNAPIELLLQKWTDYKTFSSTVATWSDAPDLAIYLRLVVTSATSVSAYFSRGGLVWTPVAAAALAYNPGFTPTTVGLATSGSATTPEAMFDWIRFS